LVIAFNTIILHPSEIRTIFIEFLARGFTTMTTDRNHLEICLGVLDPFPAAQLFAYATELTSFLGVSAAQPETNFMQPHAYSAGAYRCLFTALTLGNYNKK
jgi:hypothetical protein